MSEVDQTIEKLKKRLQELEHRIEHLEKQLTVTVGPALPGPPLPEWDGDMLPPPVPIKPKY